MEVIAVILLIIGALAIGTTADEDSPPSEEPARVEFVSGVQTEGKEPDGVPSTRCHHAAGSIQQRDLTVPYKANGKTVFAGTEKKAGMSDEE